MKRKVIQIANSTQLISLPRKWALEHGIKKGDEVQVDIDANTLIVSTGARKSGPTSIRIDSKGMGLKVKRMIGALYRAGYDEIIVHYENYESLKPVQDMVRESLIGFELIEQKKEYVVLKKVSETMDEEFGAMVKRMVMYLITMAHESHAALDSQDEAQLHYAAKMDVSMNKFMDFCGRVLSLKGNKESWAIYPAILAMEQAADEYKRLCNFAIQTKTKPTKRVVKLFGEINEFVQKSYDLFTKFSASALKKHYHMEDSLQEKVCTLRAEATKAELKYIHYLTNILESITMIDSHLMIHHSMKKQLETIQ